MRRFFWAILVLVVLAAVLLSLKDRHPSKFEKIPLSSFYTMMNDGFVARLRIQGNEVFGTLAGPELISGQLIREFRTVLPSGAVSDWRFTQWLLEHSNNTVVEVEQENGLLANFVLPLIPWLLIFLFLWFFAFRKRRSSAAPSVPLPVVIVNPEAR
jgi:ATP-dependent Zn protease